MKGHIFDSLFLHLSPKRHFSVKRCNLAGLAPLMRRRWCSYRPRHNGTSLHFTQTLLMHVSRVLVHVHKFTPMFVLENTLFTMHAMCHLWVNFDCLILKKFKSKCLGQTSTIQKSHMYSDASLLYNTEANLKYYNFP